MPHKKVILVRDIWHDIKSNLLFYIMLMLAVLSSFAVVYFTHLNRLTISEIEVLLSEKDRLENEWRNLKLEQNSLAEHSAVESRAKNKLDMIRPDADSEVMIKIP